MLTLYLLGLVIGGVLLLISTVGGHAGADTDADADADADGDADADADPDADADADGEAGADAHVDSDGHAGGLAAGAAGAAAAWLPVGSLRFWVFFVAFFGLTGTLFTLLGLATVPVTLGVAALMGWLAGASVTWVVRRLRRSSVTSALETKDWNGAQGRVLLPFERGGIGKVRLELRGRTIDAVAVTDDELRLDPGEDVLVYGVRDDGVVEVTHGQCAEDAEERSKS